jgi:hypothetical protein
VKIRLREDLMWAYTLPDPYAAGDWSPIDDIEVIVTVT